MRGLNNSVKAALPGLVLGALCFFAFPAHSQTNISRAVPGRYLFIVETSHSMGRRADGVIKTVANLLFTGMNGQIRSGDSIGVWTYNQELYTGRLPLQRWWSMEQREIGATILKFLKDQKYEKQPKFSSVRPAFDKVVKDSELITVILVSSGEEPMTGTPFDDQINQLYKTWREEQEKTRMPLVTVLRAKRGAIVSYSVTPSPWQVEIPAWPAEPVAKAAPAPAPLPKVQPPILPPLIVTGKKPKPVESSNSAEIVATENASANPATTLTKPAINAAVESPPNNSASKVTLLERKVEQPAETAPVELASALSKDPIVTNSTVKSETASPATPINANFSNPAPVELTQKSAPPPQDISAGVLTPGIGLFSNKIVWIGGIAVLGLAFIALVMLARRPRSDHISLITHSLGREGK